MCHSGPFTHVPVVHRNCWWQVNSHLCKFYLRILREGCFFGGGVFGWLVLGFFVCGRDVVLFCFCFTLFCVGFIGLVLVFIIFQTRDIWHGLLTSLHIFHCVFLARIIHHKVGLLQITCYNLQFLSVFEIRQWSKIKPFMSKTEI